MLAELVASLFPGNKQSGPIAARSTEMGSLAVASVEPLDLELTRAGRRFSGIGVAAGAAPVQAIPTTTATHALFNPAASGVVLSLDEVGVYLLSGTATAGSSLFGVVTPVTATLPAAASGSLIASRSGSAKGSKTLFATAYTIAVSGSAQWFQIGQDEGAIPGVGGGKTYDVRGRIVVPPGYVLGLAVMAGVGTTPLYVPTATWTEINVTAE